MVDVRAHSRIAMTSQKDDEKDLYGFSQKKSHMSNVKRLLFISAGTATFYFVLRISYFQSASTSTRQKSGNISDRSIPYNLPNIMKVRSFLPSNNYADFEEDSAERFDAIANAFPNSIAEHYAKFGQVCGLNQKLPYVPAIQEAFAAYGGALRKDVDVALAMKESTITVQLVDGFNDSWTLLLSEIERKVDNFTSVLLAPNPNIKDDNLIKKLKDVLHSRTTSVSILENENGSFDKYSYTLSVASHLYVHGGAEGALAALSNSKGIVYISSDLKDYFKNDEYKWSLSHAELVDGKPLDEKQLSHRLRFNAMGPVKPTCCNFQGFGIGDEEKIVCINARDFNVGKCWILSLGSSDKWLFEEDAYAKTNCEIHTFDCTGNFTVPEAINDRVHIHKYCIGEKPNNWPMADLIEFGSRMSGIPETVPPIIAKIDVEGSEFQSLQPFIQDYIDSGLLPHQILLEVHVSHRRVDRYVKASADRYEDTAALIGEFFSNFSNAGYDLVHRADNPFCDSCSEVNLLHRSSVPSSGS